jgi:hypothetical protein
MRTPRPSRISPTTSSAFEALEARALLTAPVANFVSAIANGTALFVDVDYHADQGLDLSTVGAGDLQLTANGRPTLTANLFAPPSTLPNGDTRAIYIINAYAGAWNYTHTGVYDIVSPAGQVKDLSGQNLAYTGVAQIWLWFSTPKAEITNTVVEPADWLLTVNYTDDTGIDTSTIDNNDISIAGPGLFPGITLRNLYVNSATDVTAVYRVPAPAGGFNYTNTGAYTVNFENNQVSDTSANAIPAFPLGSYWLWFDKPAAQIQTYTVTQTQLLVPILYSGRSAIDPTSISSGDIQVTALNGYSQTGHLEYTNNNGDGTYLAVYSVNASFGNWDYLDNSTYTVTMQGNRVHDTSSRYVAGGALASYGLWWNNPHASMVLPLSGSTLPTAHQWDFSVDFSDNGTVDASSITGNAVRVVGPGGNLSVTLLGTTAGPNGSTRATFRLSSVGTLANGAYEVWTNANQVQDTDHTHVGEVSLAAFWFWFS